MTTQDGRQLKPIPVAILFLLIIGGFYLYNPSLFNFSFMSSYEIQAEDYFGFKGKIKSYTTADHEISQKFGEWEIGDIRTSYKGKYSHEYFFDKTGLFISSKMFDDGKLLHKKVREFDEKKRFFSKETEYKPDGTIEEVTKIVIIQDDDTRTKTEQYQYNSEGRLTWKDVEILDKEDDKLTRLEVLGYSGGWDGKLSSSPYTKRVQDKMKYDKEDRMISTNFVSYNNEGKVNSQNIYETDYSSDNSGKVITQITKDIDGNLESKTTYKCGEFDKVGNCTKILVYNGENLSEPKYATIRAFEYY